MILDKQALVFQGKNGRDEFKREQIADKAISLLTSEIEVSPMVIDGDWGTGKTEFCHKLINKFKANHAEYSILYIDAFQADHADNPLMTILAEVMTLVPKEKKKAFLQKVIPFVRYAIKTAAKAAVSHALKTSTTDISEGFNEHIQDAANTAIDVSVIAMLKDHEKAKENLEALQIALSELAEEKPIVIFIDELDRCRPDFAVQMLEVIKHTFDVKGVQFVLVTNTTQLRAAINHRYGPLVDAQRYLDKFLKFSFCLPDGILGTNYYDDKRLASTEHFNNLIKKSTTPEGTGLDHHNNGVSGFIKLLIAHNNLSLREVETFVRHLEILQTLNGALAENKIFGYKLLQIFGVYIFCFKADIQTSIHKNNTDAKKIVELLSHNTASELKSGHDRRQHLDVIAILLAQECKHNQGDYHLDTEDAKRWREEFSLYFERNAPIQGERFRAVKEAMNSLSLN